MLWTLTVRLNGYQKESLPMMALSAITFKGGILVVLVMSRSSTFVLYQCFREEKLEENITRRKIWKRTMHLQYLPDIWVWTLFQHCCWPYKIQTPGESIAVSHCDSWSNRPTGNEYEHSYMQWCGLKQFFFFLIGFIILCRIWLSLTNVLALTVIRCNCPQMSRRHTDGFCIPINKRYHR